jgi:hypothetical protein
MNWKINGSIFADSYLSNVTVELSNMAVDRLTFEAPGRSITDSSLLVFDQAVSITRDGAPFFSGRCGRAPVHGDDKHEGHSYEVLGPWDQLERVTYMQRWKSGAWVGEAFVPEWKYKSRCVLGQNEEGEAIPAGEIISAVIDYAKSCGVSVTSGAIDGGPYLPWDEVIDMSCADIIRRLARWLPGSVGYFDYSTPIPMFNFKVRSGISHVSLAVGDPIVSVNLTAVGSRSVPSVVLIYEQTSDVNGATMLSTSIDAYPPASQGREIGALVQTINLPGWSSSTTVQKQTVHCRFIPPFDNDPNMYRAWFLKCHPEWTRPGAPNAFDNLRFSNVVITSVTRDSTLNFELVEGTLQDWMRKYILDGNGDRILNPNNKYSYEDAEDNIMTTISYKVLDENGVVTREVVDQVVTTKVVATNCPPGTYKNVDTSISAGDEVPSGLAKYLYDTLNANHFRGSIVIAEDEVTGDIKLGKRIVIAGGKEEWATMSAVIQSIQSNLNAGTTVIQVGPPNHLSANDMIELRRANRVRKNCMDADARITGEQSTNNVELGSAMPKGFGSSTPGRWGGFIDLVSGVGVADKVMTVGKTSVHVNMIGAPSSETFDLEAILREIITTPEDPLGTELTVITSVQFYDNKLQVKTKGIRVLAMDEAASDWITITTAEACS